MNSMVSHDAPILGKKIGKKKAGNPNSEKDNAFPSEEGRIYGIERLNLSKPANDLESDSKSKNESKPEDNSRIESE